MDPTMVPETDPRAEQLLRDAYLLRMRQQWGAAEELCRKALELAPDDLQGLELLGDLLTEKGSDDEALAVYRRAFELHPEKASLEEKIAKAVLRKAEEERQRVEAQLLLNSRTNPKRRKRNQTVAVLLSVVCPGGGQFFNGRYVKGGAFLVLCLLCLGIGCGDAMKLMIGMAGVLPRGVEVNGLLATLGMVGGLSWLASLLDASAQAGKSGNRALVE